MQRPRERNKKFHATCDVHLYYGHRTEERIKETYCHTRFLLKNHSDVKKFIRESSEASDENLNPCRGQKTSCHVGRVNRERNEGQQAAESRVQDRLSETQYLITPFFQLDDLSLWADHTMGDKELQTVSMALGKPTTEDQQPMEPLVATLEELATQALARLEA